jgi:hypothetical protein
MNSEERLSRFNESFGTTGKLALWLVSSSLLCSFVLDSVFGLKRTDVLYRCLLSRFEVAMAESDEASSLNFLLFGMSLIGAQKKTNLVKN